MSDHRNENTGERNMRRAPRSESQHDSSAAQQPPRQNSSNNRAGNINSNNHSHNTQHQRQTHMAPADFRALSSDKKREVRQQERNTKKEMKRSMSYFRHVGEALTDASSSGAAVGPDGQPIGDEASQRAARAGIVDGFSTELIKKLRKDFSLLYRSSDICRTIEKALAAGASRAHVDALLFVFLGHMRDLLSTPKTSFLIETLFAALYHTVGMECQQRGGAAHLDDVVETPSAASTPSLKQLLETFAEEICAELDPQQAKGGSVDWIYQRSAARGLASILKSLSGQPSRGAPAHEGVALHFAVLPIAKTIRSKLCRTPLQFLEAALDNSMTFVLQALIASPNPTVAEMWVKDIVSAPETIVPALLAPSLQKASANNQQQDDDDAAENAAAAAASNNGARILEAAINSCPQRVSPVVVAYLQKNKRVASETSLFVLASLVHVTESHTDVLDMYRTLVQTRLPGVLVMENASFELSALAKVVRRIHAIQGAGLPKPVKDIRKDVVASIIDACRTVNQQNGVVGGNNNTNNIESGKHQKKGSNKNRAQEDEAAAAQGGDDSGKKQHPLLILCGPSIGGAKRTSEAAAESTLQMRQQQQMQRQRASLELLEALLNFGLGPASMLVHSWEKIPADQLRDFACTNVGSRALQLLVPHIASTKMTSHDLSQAADALDPQNATGPSGAGANTTGAAAATHGTTQQYHGQKPHVTLQPNLQKFLRRLSNGEVGDSTCRATTDFPTLQRLICNSFAAFLLQRVYDEALLWIKAALVRRVAKLMERPTSGAASTVEDDFDPAATYNNLSAKKLALHLHVDQFQHRPEDWRLEAERAVGAKKLMAVVLAAEG